MGHPPQGSHVFWGEGFVPAGVERAHWIVSRIGILVPGIVWPYGILRDEPAQVGRVVAGSVEVEPRAIVFPAGVADGAPGGEAAVAHRRLPERLVEIPVLHPAGPPGVPPGWLGVR